MKQITDLGIQKTDRPLRVVQFGEGNFLRAFVDEMIDNLNNQTGADVGVCIAQPLERGMVDMLREQDHLYTVMLRGREEKGDVKKMIYSVLRHRVTLNYAAVADNVIPENIINTILGVIPTP